MDVCAPPLSSCNLSRAPKKVVTKRTTPSVKNICFSAAASTCCSCAHRFQRRRKLLRERSSAPHGCARSRCGCRRQPQTYAARGRFPPPSTYQSWRRGWGGGQRTNRVEIVGEVEATTAGSRLPMTKKVDNVEQRLYRSTVSYSISWLSPCCSRRLMG